ncbi:hypothetical protein [Caenimonas sp. SL110]|uniref:hypothetical protein n=1 Tax=Caenimonas sp. SL110 TaxID=1450524 RepID=UPI000652E855|nr:hypothetical protein [Caenimonas sp. SL110]
MKIFFRNEQVANQPASFSPSACKPALVVHDWLRRGLITQGDIHSFPPVTRADLTLAHDPDFVQGILDLEIENGFGTTDPELTTSLYYTTGSLLAASRQALGANEITCSPTSGFHHAGYARAGGYCTFNGLMVVAMKLLKEGAVRQVGIIDCDVHFADGTEDIIGRLRVRKQIKHHTMGNRFRSRSDVGPGARGFFSWLQTAVEDCREADLVIYQAGADPHIDDPLGGLLTTAEMSRRDAEVFTQFQGRALVWNLAGGYQVDDTGGIAPVLRLHRNTLRAALVAHQEKP